MGDDEEAHEIAPEILEYVGKGIGFAHDQFSESESSSDADLDDGNEDEAMNFGRQDDAKVTSTRGLNLLSSKSLDREMFAMRPPPTFSNKMSLPTITMRVSHVDQGVSELSQGGIDSAWPAEK